MTTIVNLTMYWLFIEYYFNTILISRFRFFFLHQYLCLKITSTPLLYMYTSLTSLIYIYRRFYADPWNLRGHHFDCRLDYHLVRYRVLPTFFYPEKEKSIKKWVPINFQIILCTRYNFISLYIYTPILCILKFIIWEQRNTYSSLR